MSEAAKKLARAAGFRTLVTPEGFDAGVARTIDPETGEPIPYPQGSAARAKAGAEEGVVAEAAARHYARMQDAISRYEAVKSKSGAGAEGERLASLELDEVADMVRRAATEAGPDGTGAVIADYASALSALGDDNPAALSMVLRRAGNPPIFDSLVGAELAEVPEFDVRAARKQVKADAKADKPPDATKAPMAFRASSVFGKPATVSKSGKITPQSKQYKKYQPKDHDPSKADLSRVVTDKETGEVRLFDPATDDPKDARPAKGSYSASRRKTLLGRMAGDQIAQVKGGKTKVKDKDGNEVEIVRTPATRQPKQVVGEDEAEIDDATLTTGALGDENRRRASWSKKVRAPVDDVVEHRNKGAFQRVLDQIDAAARNNTIFDPDKVIPWWRRRIAIADKDGNLQYPNALPSAEWVTGILQWHYKFGGDFAKRYGRVIRDSLAAAPDAPSTARARKAENSGPFLPSKQFLEVLKAGPGTPAYPHAIYGPRKVERPPVDAAQETAKAKAPEMKKAQMPARGQEALEKLKRLQKAKKPGNTDQSSIYTMPGASALQGLLA